jgi:hypothetical protein
MVVAINKLDSMGISIARRSTRDDKRQPRVGQLQLRRVNRVEFVALQARARDRFELTRRQASGDALQRVPCGHLCVPTLVGVLADAGTRLTADGEALRFQPVQTREIHRFEWQAVVKAGVA